MSVPSTSTLDALRAIVGPKGVIEGDAAAPYLSEWRDRWHGQTPLILAPKTTQEIAAVVKICADNAIAITPQGGNTGLVGGQIPMNGEILLSLKRLRAVRNVSPTDNTMTLDAGVTLLEAQEAAAEANRLFPLSIGSEGSCQIGGVLSTNAGGVNVLRYGNMRDLVLGIEAVLPTGEIWNNLKHLRKDNTGYDLKQLFIGAEGTLGVVTGAVVKLFPQPAEKITMLASLPDTQAALALLTRAQTQTGGAVTSFEIFSQASLALVLKNIANTRDPFEQSHPWYALIEISAAQKDVMRAPVEEFLGQALEAGEINDAVIADNQTQTNAFWHIRHSMSEAMRPEGHQAKHDISVSISAIPQFLKTADAAVEKVAPGARVIAFGHMGDGNIHYDIVNPAGMSDEDFKKYHDAIEQAVYDVIDQFDGSISAEHGIGLARRDDLVRRKSPAEIAMMRAVKSALDPKGIMNPGKMLPPLS